MSSFFAYCSDSHVDRCLQRTPSVFFAIRNWIIFFMEIPYADDMLVISQIIRAMSKLRHAVEDESQYYGLNVIRSTCVIILTTGRRAVKFKTGHHLYPKKAWSHQTFGGNVCRTACLLQLRVSAQRPRAENESKMMVIMNVNAKTKEKPDGEEKKTNETFSSCMPTWPSSGL